MAARGGFRGAGHGPNQAEQFPNYMEQKYVVDDTTPKTINSIQFSMMNPHQMLRAAELRVSARELYQPMSRIPYPHGPLDLRLGTSVKKGECSTCGESVEVCPGHFGAIDLALPVFHIGYMKQILAVLRMICKTCSRILLSDKELKIFRKSVRSKRNFDMSRRKEVQKKILKQCEKVGQCLRCSAPNGPVKKPKGGPFKLFHAVFRGKDNQEREAWKSQFADAIKSNQEITDAVNNVRSFRLSNCSLLLHHLTSSFPFRYSVWPLRI